MARLLTKTQVRKKKVFVLHIIPPELKIPKEDIEMVCRLFAECTVRGDYNYAEVILDKKSPEEIDALREEGGDGFNVEGNIGTASTVEEAKKVLGVTDDREIEVVVRR